jgi:hypothetical protein
MIRYLGDITILVGIEDGDALAGLAAFKILGQ